MCCAGGSAATSNPWEKLRSHSGWGDRILKHLVEGDNVLVVAHGNSLRGIIKYVENLQVRRKLISRGNCHG